MPTHPLTVLSLFDGMSCGQLALQRAGIPVAKYYASEIDKYAIKVTQNNFPNTIQLGDVTKVNAQDLPKIDLIIGGSPCQGFSFAGKGLNFEDPRSKLFFEFVRLAKECNPKYFLLENVKMKKEHELVISKYMGVAPIEINSALLSAQNRVRLYWTNINQKPYGLFGDMYSDIPQPKGKGILLKDVLESEVDEKYFIKESQLKWWQKNKEFQLKKGYSSLDADKGITQTARQYASWNGNFVSKEVKQLNSSTESGGKQPYQQNRVYDPNGISPALMAELSTGTHAIVVGGDYRSDEGFRERDNGKTGTLQARARNDESCGQLAKINERIRRLTPIECERLQNVPDNYSNCVSDSQRYKMLGNGWTVDVVAHIFSFIQ